MHRVAIDALQPGMVIVRVTQQNGPVTIKKSGLVSSAAMIAGLAEMGVQEVEIDPSQTVEIASVSEVTSPNQKMLARHQQSQQQKDQYNRSMLLPSVNEVGGRFSLLWSNIWRYGLVIIPSLLLGFAVSQLPIIWSALSGSEPQYTSTEAAPEKAVTTASIEQDTVSLDESQTEVSVESVQNTEALQSNQSEQRETVAPVVAVTNDSQTQQPQPSQTETADNEAPVEEAAVSEVSPELLARFEQAVAVMEQQGELPTETAPRSDSARQVPRVDQLPAWILTELPSMSFSTHMYASEQPERWVTVNDIRVQEGEWINQSLRLVEIQPQKVILEFKGNQFSMNALTDW